MVGNQNSSNKHKVTSPSGDVYYVLAPEGTTEQQVIDFARPRAATWEPGRTYRMIPSGQAATVPNLQDIPETPESDEKPQSARNLIADEKVAALDKELAEIDAQIAEISNKQGRTRAVLLGGRGEAEVAADRKKLADLKRDRSDLMRYKSQFEVGERGSTVGGVGGAFAGAVAGGAVGSVVPLVGTAIGAIIGSVLGAAAGSGVGSLWDVKEARKQREISDKEALHIAGNRAVTSLVVDGAFAIVLGAGGRMLGRVAVKSPAFRELQKVANEIFNWDDIKNMSATQRKSVTGGKRADRMLPKHGQSVTEAIAPERRVTPHEANQALLEDLAKNSRTGDAVPSVGAVQGRPGSVESSVRRLAPERFQQGDTDLVESALAIRDRAINSLDAGGALEGQALGNAVERVVQSADRTLKRVYGPVFAEARNLGHTIDMSEVVEFLDTQIARKTAWKPAEMSELKALRQSLIGEKNDVFGQPQETLEMGFGAAQDLLSRLKAMSRGLLTGNEAPTRLYTTVIDKVINQADNAYMAAMKEVDPTLAIKLKQAREAYRVTMGDLYSETMVAIAKKRPEDIGAMLSTKGTVTEIQDIRQTLERALKQAPNKSRYKTLPNGERQVVEYGKEELDKLRRQIDAGVIKGFIEKETGRLTTLDAKLGDQKFRQTLRELLLGKGVADKQRGAAILTELDRMNGALKLVNPEILKAGAPLGSEFGLGGFGAGTLTASATGGKIGPTTLLLWLTASVGGKLIAKAVATSMTHANTGILRKMTQAITLARAAGTSPAAAEAATRLTKQIINELGPLEEPSVAPVTEPAPSKQKPKPAPAEKRMKFNEKGERVE